MALSNLDVARDAFAITPNDNADLPATANGLFIGTGAPGTLTVVTMGGNTVTFGAVPAGANILLAVKRVLATGTTVSNIVGYK